MKPVLVCSCSFNMAKKQHLTIKKVLLYFICNGIVNVYHMIFNYYYAFPILILKFIGIPVRLR